MPYTAMDKSSSNYLDATADSTCPWLASTWVYASTSRHYIAYTSALELSTKASGLVQVASHDGYRAFDATMTAATGWTHLLVARGTYKDTTVYQDGTALTGTGLLDDTGWTGTLTVARGGATMFDFRIMDGTYDSSVWAYYRSDVLLGGDRVLPS